MINSIIYFILGLLLFIYLLIEELKYYPKESMSVIVPPRKKGYYANGVYNIVLIFNVCTGVVRLIGSGLLFYYRISLKKVQLRGKYL